MKIGQCFLELRLKMSVYFLRHSVDLLATTKVPVINTLVLSNLCEYRHMLQNT